MVVQERSRHVAPVRSYGRKPLPSYQRSSKRDVIRREELPPPRSRAAVDYGSRSGAERRSSYKSDYPSRASGYPDDVPRSAPRAAPRRTYIDDYDRRVERAPPSYREGRSRDYESASGSKRQYSAMEDAPPRYADTSVRQSRARLDYGVAGSSQYADAYSDRLGRSHLGYGTIRSALFAQESHGVYASRQGVSYSRGVYGGSESGGVYSSSYGSDYMPRGADVGDWTYSSLYSSSRGMGGSSYLGGGSSGSYDRRVERAPPSYSKTYVIGR